MPTVENITRSIEQEARRDQVLHSPTEGSRAALGTLRAAVTQSDRLSGHGAELRERFVRIIDEEAARMSDRPDRTMADFSDSLKTRWPLEDVLGIDIVAAAQRRIEDLLQPPSKTEEMDDALWIKADSFSLVFAIAFGHATAGTLRDSRVAFPPVGPRPSGLSRHHLERPGDVFGNFLYLGAQPMRLSAETTPQLARRHRPPRRRSLVPKGKGRAPGLLPLRPPGGCPESAAVALDDEARAAGGRSTMISTCSSSRTWQALTSTAD